MLQLPDVTLCAVSSANVWLTQRAIELSCKECSFGDTVLLTNADVSGNYRVERTDEFPSLEAINNFIFRDLIKFIQTPYVLLVQWDGYVTCADAWNNEFLDYDYTGAKWPWHPSGLNVGNGGFSLRSRKLLETLARDELRLPGTAPEDDYICRILRPNLEREGIKFAPERVADQFSYERAVPTQATFGFHGPFNMWRHIDPSELSTIVENLDDYAVKHRHFIELLGAYQKLGRRDLVDLMERKRAEVYR